MRHLLTYELSGVECKVYVVKKKFFASQYGFCFSQVNIKAALRIQQATTAVNVALRWGSYSDGKLCFLRFTSAAKVESVVRVFKHVRGKTLCVDGDMTDLKRTRFHFA